MKHFAFILLLAAFMPVYINAAGKIKNVSAQYIYYADTKESIEVAKIKAAEEARLRAIANEFGTVLTQVRNEYDTSKNGEDYSYTSQLNESEVRGEWIEDSAEPTYEIALGKNNLIIIKCTVSGKARELSNESPDFAAILLKNGTEEKFADTRFNSGDDMFLLFQSPTDGYIAAYLVDETQTAFCLLPYMSSDTGQYAIKKNRQYVFFSTEKAPKGDVVDEYTMTCNDQVEYNRVYVIFSPNAFTKALDSQQSATAPRALSLNQFTKWLTNCRKRDTKMGVKVIPIEIHNG